MIVKRAIAIACDIRLLLGYSPQLNLLTDSMSAVGRIKNDTGVSLEDAPCYKDLISLKQSFQDDEYKMVFVNDKSNVADVLTKYVPRKNVKMMRLIEAMNGRFKVEKDEASGR